jgi:subtilisin family serine protease
VTIGDGTSYATPIIAGLLAMVKRKYPVATGNQLIQTLIRNTGTGNHSPARDAEGEVGYGLVSLDHTPARTASRADVESWLLPSMTGGVGILVLTLLLLAVVTRRKKRAISLES